MFRDRRDAGRRLALVLRAYKRCPGGLVVGLPRGGAVVAEAVAESLELPWDLFVAKKLAAPWNPELAMGAVTETGSIHLNEDLLKAMPVPSDFLSNAVRESCAAACDKQALYRCRCNLASILGRTVILVDDGIATGATFIAAAQALRGFWPARLVAAAPVAPAVVLEKIRRRVDELLVLEAPEDFECVAAAYERFEPVEDSAVIEGLRRRWKPTASRA